METLRDLALPPGFGFHPKDTELISHYLKKKIFGQKIEFDVIPEVDIYKHEPWDLPAKCNLPTQDNKWHFFAARDRKYPNGSRSNRATIAGYWKSTGKDRTIKISNQTIGTKKTLVFHAGRPPSGRRTEWIMHEYYIDENECRACPDMKDAFVLCRVTKRDGWTSEKDTEVDNSDPHPQQPNDAATSVISAERPDAAVASVIGAEQQNHVATSVTGAELPSDVTISSMTADTATPNGDIELQAWLEELFDPSFNPVQDPVSPDLSLAEQSAESSNLQNLDAVAPKVEPDYASPNQNWADDTDYLLPEDIYNILYPGTDDFNHGVLHDPDQAALAFANQTYMMGMDAHTLPNNVVDGTLKEELQLSQENYEPDLSNETADTGIIVRRRRGTTPATSMSPSSGRVRLQLGINRMVTSNSESINQTIKFVDNSGRLDLMTNVEHQKKHAHDVTPAKQSDAGKPGKEHSNKGFFRVVRRAFRVCSAAGLKILIAVCMIGVAAAVILHHGRHRPGVSL
uniref:NAC4 transcription factor n=1 Tax=Bambusa emeiensis TaxID=280850 RepID=A0A2P0N9K6_BAMEM|nr:NAC4 transcription factor [Bambusa emeiensis]